MVETIIIQKNIISYHFFIHTYNYSYSYSYTYTHTYDIS